MQKLNQEYENLIIEEKSVVDNMKKADSMKKEIQLKSTKLKNIDKQIETLKIKEELMKNIVQETKQKENEELIHIDIGNLKRSIDILNDFVELEGMEFNDRSEIFDSYFEKISDASDFYNKNEENNLQIEPIKNELIERESKYVHTISSTNNDSIGFCEHAINMEILNTFASDNNENIKSHPTNIEEYANQNANDFYKVLGTENHTKFLESELEALKLDYELLQLFETNEITTPAFNDFNNQVINFDNTTENNMI